MKTLALVLALTLTACGAPVAEPETSDSTHGIPSPMINFAVTQQTIRTTICVPGWTAKIRPPTSYTNALKKQQLAAMARTDPSTSQNLRDWQEDHTMPLTLGGSARNPANLSPIPWPVAYRKDAVARRLNRRVCTRLVGLDDARRQMLRWREIE